MHESSNRTPDNIRVSGIREIGRTIGNRKIFQMNFLDARYRRVFIWSIYIYIFRTNSHKEMNNDSIKIYLISNNNYINYYAILEKEAHYLYCVNDSIKMFQKAVQKLYLNNQIKQRKSCLFSI